MNQLNFYTNKAEKKMEPDLPPEEHPLGFQTEVAIRLEYLKQFPVLDDSERNMEENVRKQERAKRRREYRRYKGPPIETEEASAAESKRQSSLRLHFNREDATRAKINAEAELQYQIWLNPILTKMASDAEKESFDVVCDKVNLKNSIHIKVNLRNTMIKNRESASMSGNGSKGK